MRFRLKPWQFFSLLAVGTIALVYAIYSFRHSAALDSDAKLVALLPRTDATVLYGDIRILKKVGVLDLIAGSSVAPEADYQEFIRQTHFDYLKDIDSLAVAIDRNQQFFVIRGRFDWNSLRQFANSHGGTCKSDFCSAPTSKPGRWASFFPIQPNVMGLAVSSDRSAASVLRPRDKVLPVPMPPQPLWVSIPQSVLRDFGAWPPAVQLFVMPLAQADRVLFSVGGNESSWFIYLEAQCDSDPKARNLKDRMEDRTRFVKRALGREKKQPDPADLTSLVAEGTFRVEGTKVLGSWPLHKELLQSLR